VYDENIKNILTVDVEEWFHTVLFKHQFAGGNYSTNLIQNINDILGLLEEKNTRATFFIVGSIADKYPDIIREIARKGHEISSHGYSHSLVYKMSKEQFAADTDKSLCALAKVSNVPVLGYRACTWSITDKMHWAIDLLRSLGFRYDSSIYPLSINPFSSFCPDDRPHVVCGEFIEFPPSTFGFLGCRLPFSGGTFLRFLSYGFIKDKINKINKKGNPAMVYVHSWEFDDEVPQVKNLPAWMKYIQYKNILSVREKLCRLLEDFDFAPIRDFL
jgi:polysaccharide deacetylase family protein (PEP-CTERM system associated)